MKPNNYYYKRIAKKVDNTIDCDKFKSNVYYMRRIAIKHGGSYTNHRSSNKYLHDWAVALGYTYTDHEYNIKYLYDIAKYYDASTQANQTENHYLIIIHDNIVPPTPSQKLHEIDVELTSGKNILSYADRTTGNEYATLTFTAKDEENAPIPNLELSLDVTGEQTSTITTDSNGQYEITYNTQGIGDVEISLSKEVDGSLLIQTYELQDCFRYDDASSDKTSSYGSPITYRGSHSGTWNYNSSNGYYGTITDQEEVMIPLSELTGKNDFTIEFDAQFTDNTSNQKGLAGICAYEDNNNYSRISCHALKTAQRIVVSGTANESETDVLTTVSVNDVLHYKFTVHNNQIIEEVTKGTTIVGTRTISYTPTNNTKYGFSLVWLNSWASKTFLKNIKIKPL